MTDNIRPFGVVQGNKDEDELPTNEYEIQLKSGEQFFEEGFLVFTSQHIAVMREVEDKKPIPVFIAPLSELSYAVLSDEVTED